MTGNRFLNSLDSMDRAAILASARTVTLRMGDTLIEADDTVETVYLPTTAHLSNVTITHSGCRLQTAVIGREGMSGLAPCLANVPCAWEVRCAVSGEALALSASDVRRLAAQRADFRTRLMVLTHFYQAQANQLAVCNTLHRVEARLVRWILTVADRWEGARFSVTQEEIAGELAVQRTSVVAAFAGLKRDRIIRHMRGSMEIVDRGALLRKSCGCYEDIAALADGLGLAPVRPVIEREFQPGQAATA